MIINGKHANIIESAVAYESGISWKSSNRYTSAIDYGRETDHLSAKISVWGTVAEIGEFRNAMPKVSETISIAFSQGEKPFGPAFNCEGENEYLLTGIDDTATAEKGIAQMSLQIAVPTVLLTNPEFWLYDKIPFSLGNFYVQDIKRESSESKSVSQKETDWSAFRHGWNRPEFTLSLLADSQAMGGTIRWLLDDIQRISSFDINCSDSMFLVDSGSENVFLLSFGNLRRLGNSGFWQADFDFARAA